MSRWWFKIFAKGIKRLIVLLWGAPLTWSMEVLRGSGQSWSVAVTIVQRMNAKRAVAVRFRYALSLFETFLERTQHKSNLSQWL